VYLDASALVKLVMSEPETPALVAYLGDASFVLSSRLSHVEVRRAVARVAEPGDVEHAASMLEGLQLIELDAAVADVAGSAAPVSLRSLEAIHLASAMSVTDEIEAFVTYDLRLADAARAAGLTVVAPA
jgi:predicted nucleic acid-binding protein